MDRQTGRIAARARESRVRGRSSRDDQLPNESIPTLLANWLRGLDSQSRWYVLIAFGFTLGFIVPAVWAYHATGSFNEAVAVLQVRPPLQLLASSMPSVGMIVVAAMVGAATAMLVPATVVVRRANRTTLGPSTRWIFVILAATSSTLGGTVLAAAALQVPAFEEATWPWAASAGCIAGGAALLLAISAGEPRVVGQRRRVVGVVAEAVGFVLAVLWIFPLGWAMSPAPLVSVEDQLGKSHSGLLLAITAEGAWIIEETPQEPGPGTVVLIDADPTTLIVPEH